MDLINILMSKREDSSDSSNVHTPEFSKIEGTGSRDQSMVSFEFLEAVRTWKQMPLFAFDEGKLKFSHFAFLEDLPNK